MAKSSRFAKVYKNVLHVIKESLAPRDDEWVDKRRRGHVCVGNSGVPRLRIELNVARRFRGVSFILDVFTRTGELFPRYLSPRWGERLGEGGMGRSPRFHFIYPSIVSPGKPVLADSPGDIQDERPFKGETWGDIACPPISR
jgi:hypothetical protein